MDYTMLCLVQCVLRYLWSSLKNKKHNRNWDERPIDLSGNGLNMESQDGST